MNRYTTSRETPPASSTLGGKSKYWLQDLNGKFCGIPAVQETDIERQVWSTFRTFPAEYLSNYQMTGPGP
jgi:hypothetical protein